MSDASASPIAVVTRIMVYPVKSTRPISRTTARIAPWGLVDDRRWAVVDDRGEKIRAKNCTSIMKITATPTPDGGLMLTAPGAPALPVTRPGAAAERTAGNRFARLDHLVVAEPAAHAWLSIVLGKPARLVWLDDPTRRRMSTAHGGRQGDMLSLADVGPLLLTSASSLRLLDQWVTAESAQRGEPATAPLDMVRFRSNVVVDGCPPFAEDEWKRVRIGDVPFRVSEQCDRCSVTTIDPANLAKGDEPIRTLARHRRWAGKVWFGVRLIPDGDGDIGAARGRVAPGNFAPGLLRNGA